MTFEVPSYDTIPESFIIPTTSVNFPTIVDDNIDEDEQGFALVAEIGSDVPDGISCFQIADGDTVCRGRRGATQIRINDNDRKSSYSTSHI